MRVFPIPRGKSLPAKIILRAELLKSIPKATSHLLVVLPSAKALAADVPGVGILRAALSRRRMKAEALADEPVIADLGQGTLAVWVILDTAKSAFQKHTVMRKALQPLLGEHPKALDVSLYGEPAWREDAARTTVYTALVNGHPLPTRKRKSEARALEKITVHGVAAADGFADELARAEGNVLCRELTTLPPNELTPANYRRRIAALAKSSGWEFREYDVKRLAKMGAGAFLAVAQGSSERDAAIVHVAYRHRRARRTVALVGKGICFDTGGHNLKAARSMLNMHEDMNGSAVALGILLAATRLKLPLNIDCWLAIAQNHISPTAYKQNDVVIALNGTTIEIVHTDAEGRMVLADTLALAARGKPDAIIDFATLTGAMVYALGNRYSGVFGNRTELVERAIAAGVQSGERLSAFPFDDDYDAALKSDIADTKQCVIAGEADHILAARFLHKFLDGQPWLHVDLSASNCEGGLGAVATNVTGFGVAWGVALLQKL
jgi:leucyl aminopeptidase